MPPPQCRRSLPVAWIALLAPLVLATCSDPIEPPTPPSLSVSVSNLDFGGSHHTLAFQISNTGERELKWDAVADQFWIGVDPSSGSNDDTVTVTVVRSGLDPGAYMGKIDITSNGGSRSVSASMQVEAVPVLSVTPTELSFGDTTTQRTFRIRNIGTKTLMWEIVSEDSWISVDPFTGADDDTIMVTVDRSGMYGGAYTGRIAVTSNGGEDSVAVSMTIPDEVLAVRPEKLDFGTTQYRAFLKIENTGGGILDWDCSVPYGDDWIRDLQPWEGSGNQIVAVTISREGMRGGYNTGEIAVLSNAGPAYIPASAWQLTLLQADFNLDAANARPDTTLPGAPAGDDLRVVEVGGSTVKVSSWSIGDLRDHPVEIKDSRAGYVVLEARVSGGVDCDSLRITWKSLATSYDIEYLDCTLVGNGGATLSSVRYGPFGVLTYQSLGGVETLPVTYVRYVHQRFEVLVDFANQKTGLSVNGIPLAQGRTFLQSATQLYSVCFRTGSGTAIQTFAIDDIKVVAGKCGPAAAR